MVDIQLYDEDGNLKDEAQPEPAAPSTAVQDAATQQGETQIQLIGEDGNVKDERNPA